jgi:phosphoribosylglycinamide formyltransferase-1
MGKASLVILISGSGSNLQAIIDAIKNNQLDAEISAVISNEVSAMGLERAAKEDITTHVIDHKRYVSRDLFDKALMQIIDPLKPDLIILAGFMRILGNDFIEHFQHKLLNIHPSLLPKYKGLHTHRKALANKDKIHGASVHYVGIELDSGPVVIQAEVPVLETDSEETLARRVLTEEHKIYPMAIKLHIEGRIKFVDNRLYFDNHPLEKPLQWKNNKLTR